MAIANIRRDCPETDRNCWPIIHFDGDPGSVPPRKRTGAVCLIASIHLHRVMSTGPAQASALAAVAHIFECSRIDQKISPVCEPGKCSRHPRAHALRSRTPVVRHRSATAVLTLRPPSGKRPLSGRAVELADGCDLGQRIKIRKSLPPQSHSVSSSRTTRGNT